MIFELRVYQPVPGQMPKLLARFRDKLLPSGKDTASVQSASGRPSSGESSNELTYILSWESLADRETRWTAFQKDPVWHQVRDDSERDGPIVASISNQILMPTPLLGDEMNQRFRSLYRAHSPQGSQLRGRDEAIIDPETWDKVLARLAINAGRKRGRASSRP